MKKEARSESSCIFARAIAGKVGRPKNLEKRAQILSAASDLFLQQGFSSTSMDLVAKSAQVSKQTVYSHFNNKDALFRAVIEFKCEEYQLDDAHLNEQTDLAGILHKFGHQLISLLHDDSVIAMHRVVIAETSTNPHVAELFYDAGPMQAIDVLHKAIQQYSDCDMGDKQSRHWALTFINMLKSDFHLRSLVGLEFALTSEQQDKLVSNSTKQLLVLMEHA